MHTYHIDSGKCTFLGQQLVEIHPEPAHRRRISAPRRLQILSLLPNLDVLVEQLQLEQRVGFGAGKTQTAALHAWWVYKCNALSETDIQRLYGCGERYVHAYALSETDIYRGVNMGKDMSTHMHSRMLAPLKQYNGKKDRITGK